MSHHLNFSRQFCMWVDEMARDIARIPAENRRRWEEEMNGKSVEAGIAASEKVAALVRASPKILLPRFGRVLADEGLRALAPSMALRLPFSSLVLEYESTEDADDWVGTKRVILAEENDGWITVTTIICGDNGGWLAHRLFEVPCEDWHAEASADERAGYIGAIVNARITDRPMHRVPATDPRMVGLSVLLDVLNALACANVSIGHSSLNRTKQPKGVIPFDAYRILTIQRHDAAGRGVAGGTHRSPREHLRRGHIRRLGSGACVWINAMVVNAGVGARVTKDYRMKAVVS